MVIGLAMSRRRKSQENSIVQQFFCKINWLSSEFDIVMWNVPNAVALWHPVRHRISLYEALAMQTIGLVWESIIYLSLPDINILLRGSISRFIIFDA